MDQSFAQPVQELSARLPVPANFSAAPQVLAQVLEEGPALGRQMAPRVSQLVHKSKRPLAGSWAPPLLVPSGNQDIDKALGDFTGVALTAALRGYPAAKIGLGYRIGMSVVWRLPSDKTKKWNVKIFLRGGVSYHFGNGAVTVVEFSTTHQKSKGEDSFAHKGYWVQFLYRLRGLKQTKKDMMGFDEYFFGRVFVSTGVDLGPEWRSFCPVVVDALVPHWKTIRLSMFGRRSQVYKNTTNKLMPTTVTMYPRWQYYPDMLPPVLGIRFAFSN